MNSSFSVILDHTSNVILGFIPRIHAKHSPLDTQDTPEYDNRKNFTKGLDVVRQCAALLERLKTHIKIHSLFCHPRAWLLARPEDLDSRDKPENDHNNLRPQCAPDTTGFLSDVYKRGTRARKTRTLETSESGVDKVVSSCEKNPNVHKTYMNFLRQRKTALDAPLHAVSSGRSMIEMLGVLAIIGVLSVGGIAGYSKAMTKFKTNTVLSQFSTIINNIQTLYIQQKDFNNLNTETAIQMGIIPDEMIASDRLSAFDAFGGGLLIENSQDVGVMDGNYFVFGVSLTSKESCLALAQADWRTFNPLFVMLENMADETNSLAYCAPDFTDCDYIREDLGVSKIKQIPFSPADTALACSTCEDENCIFGMYIPK